MRGVPDDRGGPWALWCVGGSRISLLLTLRHAPLQKQEAFENVISIRFWMDGWMDDNGRAGLQTLCGVELL